MGKSISRHDRRTGPTTGRATVAVIAQIDRYIDRWRERERVGSTTTKVKEGTMQTLQARMQEKAKWRQTNEKLLSKEEKGNEAWTSAATTVYQTWLLVVECRKELLLSKSKDGERGMQSWSSTECAT